MHASSAPALGRGLAWSARNCVTAATRAEGGAGRTDARATTRGAGRRVGHVARPRGGGGVAMRTVALGGTVRDIHLHPARYAQRATLAACIP